MIELSSQTKSESSSSNTCPECKFSGSKDNFPKGFAPQNLVVAGKIYPVKHCPKCGYWEEKALAAFNVAMDKEVSK